MIGWRKFIVAALALIMGFILALRAQLVAEFSTIVSIVTVAYIGGNAFEHHTKSKGGSSREG